MHARSTAMGICLGIVGCSQSHPPDDAGRDAPLAPQDAAATAPDGPAPLAPQDAAAAVPDGPRSVCTDPLAGALTDGAVIEEPAGFETEGSSPHVAMDEQGNGIVTWLVQSSVSTRAMARRYTAGVGWSDIEVLLQDSYPTSVALRNGIALVAVVGPTAVDAGLGNRTAGIYAARFAAGAWSTQSVGVTSTGWWQEPYTSPPVAVLGQSAALLSWVDARGYVAASVFDSSWQPAQLFGWITRDATAVMLPSGTFAVAWSGDGSSTYNDFLVSAWDPAAGWLPAVTVSQAASYPMLAACDGGRPHALWSVSNVLMHAEQLPSGAWSAGEAVVTVDNATNLEAEHLATDLAGNALVAWTSSRSACNSSVTARYYVEGVGWQDAIQLNASSDNNNYELADLAMSPSGDAWALVRSGPCNDYDREIWALQFQRSSGWGQPVRLASAGHCVVRDGTVAMGGSRTLAAWSQSGAGKIVVRWLE